MAEFDIQGRITYDASQATNALKATTTAANQTAVATGNVSDATSKAQVSVGQFGSAIGLAGQAVGKLNPQIGGLVTIVGSATGAMQSMISAGLGPVGISLGILAVGLAAGVEAFNRQEEAIKRNEEALRQYDRIQSEIAARRREYALDKEIEDLDEQYRQSEAGRRARNQALWEQQYDANRQADLRNMALLVQQFDDEEAERQERSARRLSNRARAVRQETREIINAYDDQRTAIAEQIQRDIALNEQTMADEAEVRARMRQQEIDESNAAKDRAIEVAAEQRDVLKALQDEQNARMQESTDAVFSAINSAMESSVAAMLNGSRSIGEAMQDMVKQIAKSLASEAIVQGLKQTALGISALAVGSPTAAGHFAAAGKWAAVGVAAGVVGAASGAFGGGGGGGGAGPAAATGGPALTAGAREGAGTTVVINWGSSGLVYAADRAQLGRDISGMISEANGRLGRGM